MANQWTFPVRRRDAAVKEAQETAFTDASPAPRRTLLRMADSWMERTRAPEGWRGPLTAAYVLAYEEVFLEEEYARIAAKLAFAAKNSPQEGLALYRGGLTGRRYIQTKGALPREVEGRLWDFLEGVWRGAYEAERIGHHLKESP